MTALVAAVSRAAATRLGTGLAIAALAGPALALVVSVFGFGVTGALSLYFVVWWTVVFMVLPFGVRSQADEGEVLPGSDPGSPAEPRLRERAIWTTAVASLVFVATASLLPYAGL